MQFVGRFRPLNARELGLGERGNHAAPRFGPEGRTVWVGPDESTGQYALDAVLRRNGFDAPVNAGVDAVYDIYSKSEG